VLPFSDQAVAVTVIPPFEKDRGLPSGEPFTDELVALVKLSVTAAEAGAATEAAASAAIRQVPAFMVFPLSHMRAHDATPGLTFR
jgi:hypothetical protein